MDSKPYIKLAIPFTKKFLENHPEILEDVGPVYFYDMRTIKSIMTSGIGTKKGYPLVLYIRYALGV